MTDAPAAEAPPTDELRTGLVAALEAELGDAVVGSFVRPGDDVWVRVATDAWRSAGEAALHRLGCRFFSFLSAIDWLPSPFGRYEDSDVDVPLAEKLAAAGDAVIETGYAGGDTRFQVFARVVNLERRVGITLKVDVPDDTMTVESWLRTYAGANWHEREAHEMFGIGFAGHPALRPLYLPTDFEGHPMRKDFPLLARVVKPWPGIVDVEPMPDEGPGEGAPADSTDDADDETPAEEGS